jgi:SAM-dependent methyltransferase
MKIRLKPLLGGIATSIVPSLADKLGRRNQPCVTAEYYYTVWMRHVCTAAHFHSWNAPNTVLEIGPGNALGTGMAALLSGVQRYIAYDATPLLSASFEAQLWQDLIALFRQQKPFAESDRIVPSTSFPRQLFPREHLAQTLSDEGLARIRHSVTHRNDLICYLNDLNSLPAGKVDYVFSHSVLEHVAALEPMYRAMWRALRPGGVMTHSIDFSSHGTSHEWNGHWTVPDVMWQWMQGRRSYFLNREPASTHRALLEHVGFEVTGFHLTPLASSLGRNDLASRFRHLSESDLNTVSAFVVARKPL